MRDSLTALLAPAVLERLTLVINHVLGSEAAASARLAPHSGRVLALHLDGWPRWLPAVPPLAWSVQVTVPSGLGLKPTQVTRRSQPHTFASFTPRSDCTQANSRSAQRSSMHAHFASIALTRPLPFAKHWLVHFSRRQASTARYGSRRG